ncbi:MAG: hypothetical protein IPJ89_05535 [Candidatus Iainarchaeum archaeon]|uniref:Uncharacterized protein n=1 Tax=Candidatus Iainarchaeum sp. TaxID=3101447 RepID=A0A7T9DJN8_9ARCH|nr:MAG: hypothetical protein IPJ89_05535 [Candidatus Diapherotrites archaeon]
MMLTAILLQASNTLTTGGTADIVQNAISGDISWLFVGIAFFIVAAMLLFFLKNLIVNTILGVIGWAILTYVFQLQLPFWASLIVSAIFGLAGLGVMVILAFLGIVH